MTDEKPDEARRGREEEGGAGEMQAADTKAQLKKLEVFVSGRSVYTWETVGLTAISKSRKIEVKRGGASYRLADGPNFPESICRAALALPEFLKQRPECAADRK